MRYMLAPPSLVTLAGDLTILRQSCPRLDRLELASRCCGKALDAEWEDALATVGKACADLAIGLRLSQRQALDAFVAP